jgi:cytochrome c553
VRTAVILICLGVFLAACSQQAAEEAPAATTAKVESAKPMALMMRAIYDQSKSMKTQIDSGKALDADFYRFLEFHQLEPTDSTVLVEVFYEHNEKFKAAYEELLRASNKPAYNAMLTACVNCHEDFCPGPIKRINKLRFAEQ